MVKRINGRAADVLKTNRFRSGVNREQTLLCFVRLLNPIRPSKATPYKP